MTTLIEKKVNGTSALSQMDGETLSKLVLNGDLSKLSEDQKMAYYVYRCKAVGLDPATKPFDIIPLQGKTVLYATKECAAQISQRDSLSITIVEAKPIAGDIYQVQARVTDSKGRQTDDLGCVSIKGMTGDALCNAMLKATTKAKRRAILAHSGLGMLDETELETIPKQEEQQPQENKNKKGKVYVLPDPPKPQDEDRVPDNVTDAAAPVEAEIVGKAPEKPKAKPAPSGQETMLEATIVAVSKARNAKSNTFGIMVNENGHKAECSRDQATRTPCNCGGDRWLNTFHDTPWETARDNKGKRGVFTLVTNEKGFTNIESLEVE